MYFEFYCLAGPRFKIRSRQEMARKGETVHLRCEADGDQPMDVTWKAKGSRIESEYEMRYVVFFSLYVSTVVCLTIT